MATWRTPVAALLMLAAVQGARAVDGFEPIPSAAQACARPKAGSPEKPEYPLALLNRNQAGLVQATVTLPGGLFGPAVKIVKAEGGDEFRDAVKQWLERLEAPCLEKGSEATLNYEFVFEPDRREAFWGPPGDADEATIKALAACLRHVDGIEQPSYPDEARRTFVQGRVHVELNFVGPDQEPQVTLHHRDQALLMARGVRRWVKGLRLPCHRGQPVRLGYTFVFILEGERAFGFKPVTLLEVLRATRDVRERALALDTTTMGCPFELRMLYLQPHSPNQVGEVGNRDARRRPVIELLRTVELDLARNTLDSIYADVARVAVPCIRIDLNPKEKTS